jgi:transposase
MGSTGRIWVCVQAVDGRKSFDGLSAIVTTHLGHDPLSGDLFVFFNRRGDRLKILAWQGDGFALYLRRLERGSFAFPQADAAALGVTPTELAMILGGVDWKVIESEWMKGKLPAKMVKLSKSSWPLGPVRRMILLQMRQAEALKGSVGRRVALFPGGSTLKKQQFLSVIATKMWYQALTDESGLTFEQTGSSKKGATGPVGCEIAAPHPKFHPPHG